MEGYARIFNLVSIVNTQTRPSHRPAPGDGQQRVLRPAHRLLVCLSTPVGEIGPHCCNASVGCATPACHSARLAQAAAAVADLGGFNKCVLFTEYSDDEYFRERCGGDEAVFHDEVGQFYRGRRIYRDDLLPVPSYLVRCVRAHRQVGDRAFLANFLDGSFLGDGKTTVRAYLRAELAGGAPRAHHGAVAHAEDDRVPDDASAKPPHWTPSEREELARAVAEES